MTSPAIIGPRRGQCSGCGLIRRLAMTTGMIQKHGACLGSGKPPLKHKVAPTTYTRRTE